MIAEFVAHSVAKISRQRNVDNPAGLLISQVPKFFPGSELQAYRVQKVRELAESREVARKVLDDSESPAEAREWLRLFWPRARIRTPMRLDVGQAYTRSQRY